MDHIAAKYITPSSLFVVYQFSPTRFVIQIYLFSNQTNTMSPTVIPQVAVAAPAIPLENHLDLLQIEEVEAKTTMPTLPVGMSFHSFHLSPLNNIEILDEGEQMAADLVAAKAKYALGLFDFHQIGSGAAILQ
jgi:hypothetical protein